MGIFIQRFGRPYPLLLGFADTPNIIIGNMRHHCVTDLSFTGQEGFGRGCHAYNDMPQLRKTLDSALVEKRGPSIVITLRRDELLPNTFYSLFQLS